MKKVSIALGVVLATLVLAAAPALAGGLLTATCTAVPNTDRPELGAWKYCVDLMWDTGNGHAASHFDLLLGLEDSPWVCEEVFYAAADTAGASSSSNARGMTSTAYYEAELNCGGDPSLGIDAPLVKYEPYADGGQPGTNGVAYFCFYSDRAPMTAPLGNEYLVVKAGPDSIRGELEGDLPSRTPPPVAIESTSWGGLKLRFTE